jgi:hypothetical protein
VGYCDHVPALLSVAAIGSAHLPTEMNLLLKIADLNSDKNLNRNKHDWDTKPQRTQRRAEKAWF